MTALPSYFLRASAVVRAFFAVRWGRCLALLVIVLLGLGVTVQLREDYRSVTSQNEKMVSAVVNAVEQHLSGRIQAMDGLLDEAVNAVRDGLWGTPQYADGLASRLESFPEILYLGVINADGRLLPGTVPRIGVPEEGVSVTAQDYYFYQRDARGPSKVYIGRPKVASPSGQRMFHLSRAVRDAQGHFAGVVVAAVNPDYYARFLRTVLLEQEGGAALIRKDGLILANAPLHRQTFGQDIGGSGLFEQLIAQSSMGVGRLVGADDGNDKLIAYRVMDSYPLVVTAGLSVHTALREWRLMAVAESVMVLVFGIAIYAWAHVTDLREVRLTRTKQQLERDILQRQETEDELRRLATTDVLTGCFNRRHFTHVATAELERARRYDRTLSMMMLDIDHFKRINDTYGHPVGDVAIKALAAACGSAIRGEDCLGRLGGEEFAIALPETTIEGAVVLAERLREATGEIQIFTEDGLEVSFTVSVGVAELSPNDDSLDALLGRADQALYEAKHGGRNRVVAARPDASPVGPEGEPASDLPLFSQG